MRNTTKPAVTKEQIKQSLKKLGLKESDIVLVHSSLSSMGWVEGGADTVIDALLEVVGASGTVMMPAFSFSLGKEKNPVFDLNNTPSEMGRITEVFRSRKGVLRSLHLTHSICALGAKAKLITSKHSVTPCGRKSPFEKLVKLGGYILLLGVDQNVSTTFHHVEETKKVSYVKYKRIPNAKIRNDRGNLKPLSSKIHVKFTYDFNRMEKIFREKGAIKIGSTGKALVRLIKARDLFDITAKTLEKNKEALRRIPVSDLH